MSNENLIILFDEDGNEVPFEFLDYIEDNNCKYVALLPLEGDLDNAEVLILQVVESENGEQDFDIIESPKLLNKLYRKFQEDHKDEFNFRD